MKKYISVLLALLLLAGLSCAAFAAREGIQSGDTMPDFTVALSDGTSATLSELLKKNDLVVLNVFATWCSPCKVEFPEMEKTYQAHRDRMVILSVSGDPADTREMIAAYKEENALSFPMGIAGDALDFLNVTAFPTTVFIDHAGKVGFYKVGSFEQKGEFEAKVNTFLSADYGGTSLGSEVASEDPLFYLLGAAAVISVILLVIGRWCLFRKAGKPSWHSVIPFLSAYQEYDICWKGWIGVLSLLCSAGETAIFIDASPLLAVALAIAHTVLRALESFRLAKAFGRKAGTGILLVLLGSISRFFLGVGKAKYHDREFTFRDGRVYEGEWKDSKQNGTGKYAWPDGRVYEGEWRDGRRHGRGKQTWPNGEVYEGTWINGEINGNGRMTWPDGIVYQGEFKDSQRNGKGKMSWPDGKTYEGEWKDDQMDGYGICDLTNDRTFRGEWKKGQLRRKSLRDLI